VLLCAVRPVGDALALAPGPPREAEATALVEASATREAHARRLNRLRAILVLRDALLKQTAPRALLARVNKRAATLYLLTRLAVSGLVLAAGAVRTGLGRV
jgi:hypothetical protein